MPKVSAGVTKDEPLLQKCMQLLTVAIPVPMMMHHELENPSFHGYRRPIPSLDYCNYAVAYRPSPSSCACRSHEVGLL